MYHIYTKTPCASYLPAAVTSAFCSADGSCIHIKCMCAVSEMKKLPPLPPLNTHEAYLDCYL